MKNKAGVIILVILSVGLLIGLLLTAKKSTDQKEKDGQTILGLSNDVVQTRANLQEQAQVNVLLTNDLNSRNAIIAELTNKLTETSTTLIKTEDILKQTQDEVAKNEVRIKQLESENEALDRQALELGTTITNLNTQIEDTQRKLASAEGDKAFLEKELQRLMAEKAELERRFNDLEVLRAQVKALKNELSIAKRLDWIRRGLFGDQKGGELQMQQSSKSATGSSAPVDKKVQPRYDLNVEVQPDGTIRLIPPTTNSPAGTNQ